MSIIQVFINSLIRSAELGLVALGLTMVYDILKFANFAHTEFLVVGVYLAYFFNVTLGFNIFLAALCGACFTGIIAICVDRLVFKPMRNTGRVTLMVTSFGLAIALQNVVRAIWGNKPRSYEIALQPPLDLLGVRVTPLQIIIILSAAAFMLLFHILLRKTSLGKAMRAASDNPELAEASGIHIEGIVIVVWFIATFFAALGGILIAAETYLLPYMGFAMIIQVFCAAILGGIGNPYGAMLGALALGIAENFGLYFDFGRIANLWGVLDWVGSFHIPTGYKPAISFSILILILLMRPAGILGVKR